MPLIELRSMDNSLHQRETEIAEIERVLGNPKALPAEQRAVILTALRARLAALVSERDAFDPNERRQLVTVLFADVSGFTAVSNKLDAEQVQDTMRQLWARLDQAILKNGGRIDKHMGDGIMAVWGARQPREDDATRAIRAALTMQHFLQEQTSQLFQMRVGINTGLVSISAIESTGESNLIGDTVNLAARLEAAAPVGGILISQSTFDQTRGLFDVTAQPALLVKGKPDPLQTYLVMREKNRTFEMTTRGIAGITTRTIGREYEMELLRAGFQRALAYHTQWITISGEAGVGKSRLLNEFNRWLEQEPEAHTTLKARAWTHTQRTPYFLLRDLLSYRFQIRDGDSRATVGEKLTAGLRLVLGDTLADEAAAFIGQLVGFDFRESRWIANIAEDTRQIRGRAQVLLRDFFARASESTPLVILLEDLHWADEESLALFADLLSQPPARRVCVIGLARPEFWERGIRWGTQADGGALAHHARIDLEPLSEEWANALVRELLQKIVQPPTWLIDLLIERGAGNPYFTEELLHWLIEQGVIETGTNTWRVDPTRASGLSVPGTVQGVLQARLECLSQAERAVLQYAAVIGRVFWDGAVEYIGQDPVPLERWQRLQQRDLVFRRQYSQLPDESEYLFKHVLLHDVVYEYTLRKRRREYHHRAAEWFTQVARERADEWAAVIAAHYEQADDPSHAAEWYARAGKRAQDTYAPKIAIDYYTRALDLLPDTSENIARRMDWNEALGTMLQTQVLTAQAIQAFHTMHAMAVTLQDRSTQVNALCKLSNLTSRQGDLAQARAFAEHAEEIARALNNPLALAKALEAKVWTDYRYGNASAALELGEQALALREQLNAPAGIMESCILLGAAHWIAGNYVRTAHYQTRALELARGMGDRRAIATNLNNLAANAYMIGDYATAADLFRQALALAREIGYRDTEMLCQSNLGGTLVGLEDYDAAERELTHVIQMAGTTSWFELANTFRFLAEAYLGQDKLAQALDAAQHAFELSHTMQAQDLLGRVWRVLGLIAARQHAPIRLDDHAYDARACYAQGLEIFTRKSAEGERARILRAWAEYEITEGDPAQGEHLRQAAREIFARLGMTLEIARTNQPPNSCVR